MPSYPEPASVYRLLEDNNSCILVSMVVLDPLQGHLATMSRDERRLAPLNRPIELEAGRFFCSPQCSLWLLKQDYIFGRSSKFEVAEASQQCVVLQSSC